MSLDPHEPVDMVEVGRGRRPRIAVTAGAAASTPRLAGRRVRGPSDHEQPERSQIDVSTRDEPEPFDWKSAMSTSVIPPG
jgi:hypothetical protein